MCNFGLCSKLIILEGFNPLFCFIVGDHSGSPPTSLYVEGLWLPCSLLFEMPPKQSKRKTAPLTTRRQTKRRTTQHIGHAVEAAEPSSQPSGSAESQPVVPAVHHVPSQEVPVISGDIINHIVARVTQEVTSQLAPLLHPTSQPPSHHGPSESPVPQVNQQNTVSTPPLPTVAKAHPAVAPVQPLSVTPTQVISPQSSVQPSLLEVPVCSLGTAAVSSSLNHIHNHLTGELNPSSALPVDVHVSEKIKTKIWANEYIDFG